MIYQSGSIGSDFSHSNFFDDFVLSVGGASAFESFETCQNEASDEEESDDESNPLLPAESGGYPANLAIYFPSLAVGRFNESVYKRYTKRNPDIHCTVRSWHSTEYPTACFHEMLPPGAAGCKLLGCAT